MHEWYRNVQLIVDEIDSCIKSCSDEDITLHRLSQKLGYSEFYISRKFREISGMYLRDYLRYRKLAFALKEIRDTDSGILDIALNYGFSSHEAFTRAFRSAYGITPSDYRRKPVPVVLRTALRPFDCYLLGIGGTGMAEAYGVRLPADYDGEVPPQMQIMDVSEGEYIVFEHGPFDFETENKIVEARIEKAMKSFDYQTSGYQLDLTPGRVFYFYHDCRQFWKYVRPVIKADASDN